MGNVNTYMNLSGKAVRKTRSRYNNIKPELKEAGGVGVNGFQLPQNTNQWRGRVNTIQNCMQIVLNLSMYTSVFFILLDSYFFNKINSILNYSQLFRPDTYCKIVYTDKDTNYVIKITLFNVNCSLIQSLQLIFRTKASRS
jgi:hypothetical protein